MTHVPFVFAIVLTAVGFGAVLLGVWMRRMSLQAASWPSVEGEIVESRLEPDPHDGDSSVCIRYRYIVRGHSYESGQLSYAGHSGAANVKQRLVEQYAVGLKVPVYYDPQRPQRAVIDRGLSNGWLWAVVVGAVFMLSGLKLLG